MNELLRDEAGETLGLSGGDKAALNKDVTCEAFSKFSIKVKLNSKHVL